MLRVDCDCGEELVGSGNAPDQAVTAAQSYSRPPTLSRRVWIPSSMGQMGKEGQQSDLRSWGPLMFALDGFIRVLEFLSPQNWIFERPRNANDEQQAKWVRQIDFYVTAWVVIEVILIALAANSVAHVPKTLVWLVVGLRLVEISQVAAKIYVFDHLRGESRALVTCVSRSLALSFINYLEIALCFTALYLTLLPQLHGAGGWASTLYFSFITQLTVGYGDIQPIGATKALAALQALLGVIFALVILARFVSSLPVIRCRIHPDRESEDKRCG